MNLLYHTACGGQTRGGSLLEALAPGGLPGTSCTIALAGAGGKTSLLRRLAWEGRERGLKVLVYTTTHIFKPAAFGVLDQPPEAAAAMLSGEGLAVIGHLEADGKISAPDPDVCREAAAMADLVLAEADGSKRLPLKVPRAGEPVVPENTDILLCLSGLSALGRPAEEVCFCLEQAASLRRHYRGENADSRLTGLYAGETAEPWLIGSEDLAGLMKWGYLEPMRQRYPGIRVLPVFNQADGEEEIAAGQHILELMGEAEGILTGGMLSDPSQSLW